jgi:hypothetical protein
MSKRSETSFTDGPLRCMDDGRWVVAHEHHVTLSLSTGAAVVVPRQGLRVSPSVNRVVRIEFRSLAALSSGHSRARGAALPPRPRRVFGARIHTHPCWTTGPHATLTHNGAVRVGLARWVVRAEAAWERLAVARRHVEVVCAEARAVATVGLAKVRHIAHVARRTSAFCTPCRLTPHGRRTLGERRRPEARQDGSRPHDSRTGSDPLQHPPPGDAVDVRPFLAHGSASRLACSSSPQPCSC